MTLARNALQISADDGNQLSGAPWGVGDPTDPMAYAGVQNAARVADPLVAWLAAQRAKQDAAKPIWNPNNPVGTETMLPRQSVGMPDPSFRPGVFAGGGTVPMSAEQIDTFREGSQNFYDQASLLAGLPGGGPASARVAASRRPLANPPPPSRGAVAETPPEPPGITAYHGSPHSFEKFDNAKIGTGEGAQAYGHGMYFAENEGVARGYRDALAKDMYYTPEGRMFDPQSQLQHMNIRVAARNNGSDLDATIARAQQLLPKASEQTAPILEHDIGVLQSFKEAGGVFKNPGHMYEVNLKADPEHFLDWDKPLSEQHPKVREAIANSPLAGYEKTSLPGSQIAPHTAEGAKALAGYGIPGIRYLDQGSRGSGTWTLTHPELTANGKWLLSSTDANNASRHFTNESEARAALEANNRRQTSNYVAFDPATIEILRKYGLAGLMAGGGAAAVTQQPNALQTQ